LSVKLKSRVGEINYNSRGSKMEIVEYNSNHNVVIRFENYKCVCQYSQFKSGHVFNPYDKSIYGKGYIGEGPYAISINKGETINRSYHTWHDMLRRCYAREYQQKNPAYIGCSVCEEWLNFQNFAKWYDENYYEIDGQIMNIDKDILVKGNRIYSPETCVFVPSPINSLFVKNDVRRKTTPVGISICTNGDYLAKCSDGTGKDIRLGRFKTYEDAFVVYKANKEIIVKKVAEKFKSYIPCKLYDTMMNYIVEITD